MGVSIGNKYHSIDGGYGMMFLIRKTIAQSFDNELGNYYGDITNHYKDDFIDNVNKILADDRFTEANGDIIDFLFMSDCEGKINYKTSKKILDLVKDVPNFRIGYVINNKSFDDFKDILQECYSKRMNLTWY